MILALALFQKLRSDTLTGLQWVQLTRYGSLFLISIVLAKSALSQESIGHFEAVILLAGAVTFFWVSGLIQSLLPLANNSDAFGGRTHTSSSPEIFNAFISLLLFSILSAGLVILAADPIARLVQAEMGYGLEYYVAAFVFFQSPASLIEYIYLLRKESRKLLRYGYLAYGFQFGMVLAAAVFFGTLESVLIALVGSAILRFIWLLMLLSRTAHVRFSWRFQLEHIRLGIPIIVSVLLSGSASYVDSLIVAGYQDAASLAVFRYGARELPLVALLAHALSSGMLPILSREGLLSGLKELKKRGQKIGQWLFPITGILLVLSYLLFPIFYDERFIASAGIFNVYLLVIVTRLLFPQTLLIAYKKSAILMLASAFELLINIGLSLVFIQFFGLPGVAFATLIAYAFERAFLIVYLRVIMGIRLMQYTAVRFHMSWSAVVIGIYIVVELWLKNLLIA